MGKIGYIKLHRQIQDCLVWDDKPYNMGAAWVDLLLLANHEDKKTIFDRKPVLVKRGQRITSVRDLASRWGWNKNKTLSFLRLLEAEGMILKESDSRKTLITVVNYDVYQGLETDNGTVKGQSRDSQGTVKGQSRDTDVPQTIMIKNDKNDNKDIGGKSTRFIPPTLDEVKAYCLERKNSVDPRRFVDFYESKGWMVGKNKMKDWKACVRTWEQNEKPSTNNMQKRDYDFDSIEKALLAN